MRPKFLILVALVITLSLLFPTFTVDSWGAKSKSATLEIISGSGDFNATAGESASVYVVVSALDPANTVATLYYRFGTDEFSSVNMNKTTVDTSRYNFTYPLSIPRYENRSIEYYVLVSDSSPTLVNYSVQRDLLIDTDGVTTSEKGNSQDLSSYSTINIAGKSELRYWDSQTSGNRNKYDFGEDVRNGSKNWDYVLNGIDDSCSLWANYTTSNKIVGDYVNVVKTDGIDVWVGTRSGLSRFNRITGVWTTYTTSSGLSDNNTWAIAFDGNLVWVGTDSGLSRYNKITNTWTKWTSVQGISGAYIAVGVDGSRIWFGTAGAGLVVYDKGINDWFGPYKMNTGYGSLTDRNYVQSIVIDNNYLWYGSIYGLIQFDKQSLQGTQIYWSGGNDIRDLRDDGDCLWLATTEGGYRFDKPTTNRVSIPTLPQTKSLYSVDIVSNSV